MPGERGVVVDPPGEDGRRQVRISGLAVGYAYGLWDMVVSLHRAGLPWDEDEITPFRADRVARRWPGRVGFVTSASRAKVRARRTSRWWGAAAPDCDVRHAVANRGSGYLNSAEQARFEGLTTGPIGGTGGDCRECVMSFATDTSLDTVDRVAGCLVVCYAQPASGIAELTTHKADDAPGGMPLPLGVEPLTIREPLAELARELVGTRRGHAARGHIGAPGSSLAATPAAP